MSINVCCTLRWLDQSLPSKREGDDGEVGDIAHRAFVGQWGVAHGRYLVYIMECKHGFECPVLTPDN